MLTRKKISDEILRVVIMTLSFVAIVFMAYTNKGKQASSESDTWKTGVAKVTAFWKMAD
jgi:hypothetical protein